MKKMLLTGLALGIMGCGAYQPAVIILPSHIRAIAVRHFVNETSVYGLEERLNLVLTDEFLRDGRIAIANEENADGVLNGKIVKYLLQPITFDANQVIEEYKLWVIVDIRFEDLVKNTILWEEKNLEGAYTFFVATKPGGITEEEAREIIWEDLSRDIVKRTIEGYGSVSGISDRVAPR
ncbi:MAG: LPS assembly lipoprotein LptE [bacterium]